MISRSARQQKCATAFSMMGVCSSDRLEHAQCSWQNLGACGRAPNWARATCFSERILTPKRPHWRMALAVIVCAPTETSSMGGAAEAEQQALTVSPQG